MSRLISNPLQLFPHLTIIAFLVPIVLGLLGTWLPASGYLPVIGAHEFNLQPFKELFEHPSFPTALKTTLFSGLAATTFSVGISLQIAIHLYSTSYWSFIQRTIAPLLAIPHAAFALGFSFLIAPSGWLIRILSPGLTGFVHPPDWATTADQWGISLMVTMTIKEIPFLLLMIIGALNQIDTKRTIWIGRSFGYHRFKIWSKLILPQLYPMLRLPILAVLAYSLSVVDLALIIGPSAPPPLSVLIDRWFNNPDLSLRLVGAAGATFLFFITVFCISITLVAEQLFIHLSRQVLINGKRFSLLDTFRPFASITVISLYLCTCLSLIVIAIWSITSIWRFPQALPQDYSLFYWSKSLPLVYDPLIIGGITGIISTTIAILLVIGCFENELRLAKSRITSIAQRSLWIVYLPLLVPQIGFLFGVQIVFSRIHLTGTWVGLIWIHLVFVFPYVFLTLANTYRNYDQRFIQVATLLTGSPWRSFISVKLVMLAKPILFSLAVGFAVSIAQYLPTLYVGAGRFATITTETVSLSSGSDRRIIGVYALCQFILPLVGYILATWLPTLLFRNRKLMQN